MDGNDLRAILAERGPILMPGVWDGLSARAAVARASTSLFLSGYAVAGTLLGLPDVGYLTQTEMADAARRVCAAVPTRCRRRRRDTGYGNALNVARTVELWEAAGAAGTVPRGPGVAEAVRAHGGQGGRGRQGSGWRSCAPRSTPVTHLFVTRPHRRPCACWVSTRRSSGLGWRPTSASTRCSSRHPSRDDELAAIGAAR